jgi:MFS family permease
MSAPAVIAPARQASRDFWLFWTGETISNLGSSFTTFALPLLVFKLTGSALNLGLATAISTLPYLLFGLVIGAWVDRLPRKRLMILVDLAQALVLASIPVLYMLGTLSIWWLYGASFVSATLKIVFECGQFAAIPSLVRQAELMTANGRMQASFSGAQVLGPMLAGMLLFALPLPTLLLFDAGSFLVSACMLALIFTSFNGAAKRAKTSIRSEVAEGLRYVWHHPVLRILSLFLPLLNLLSIITLSQIVVLATVHFHTATWQISALYSAAGAGVVLCSLLAGPLRRRLSFSRLVFGTVAAAGLLTVALALVPWYWVAVVIWAFKSGMEVLFNLSYLSLRQALVPNHLLGRVISSSRVLAYSTGPLGALMGGLLLTSVGVAHVDQVYLGIGLLIVLVPVAFARTALARAERFLPAQRSDSHAGGSHDVA